MDDGDEQEQELSLQITPSFRARGKKSRGGVGGSRSRTSIASSSGVDAGKKPETVEADDLSKELDQVDQGDRDGETASAVVFKKSSRKHLGGAIGGSTGGSSSSSKKQAGAEESSTNSSSKSGKNARSKLSLSFGANEQENDESVQEGGGDDDMSSNASASIVKRSDPSSGKLKRPQSMLPKTSKAAADGSLSNSMSLASISSNRPTYSKDYLDQLKASNSSTPRNENIASSLSSGYDSLTMSKFGHVNMENDGDTTDSILPSENAIAAAKLRRETARRLGVDNHMNGNDEFISLEVGMPRKKGESRLVREEDEIGEGEDDHAEFTEASERVPLGKKGRATLERQRKAGIREAIDEVMAEEDENELLQADDEEAREWEMAQIRRGEQRRRRDDEDLEKVPYRPAVIPEQTAIPNLLSTSNRLMSTLQELQTSKTEHDTVLASLHRERTELDAQETELRIEVERVSAKYEWYTETKGWVEDVASFLDEKFPKLEKVEADNDSIQRERMDLIEERRYKDDSDDVASFTGAVNVPVVFKRPSEESARELEEDVDMMDVDELGRSRRDMDEGPKSQRRQTRRQERLRRRALASTSDSGKTSEGYETDDDLLVSDSQDLSAAGEAMTMSLSSIFDDVQAEEFLNPAIGIRPKFEDWKHRYGEEYAQTFASLAMVGVWEFWTRTELASWNPFGIKELSAPPASLDAYRWHQALADFQHAREASAEPKGEMVDPQDDPVNAMVTTVVIPRLRKLTTVGFDPYSSKATNRGLAIVEEITYCLETNHQRFEHLILGFLTRFQLAILRLQSLLLPLLNNIQSPAGGIDIDSIVARNRLSQRMFKLLNNALRWRRYAKNFVLPAGGEGEGVGAGLTWEACLARDLVGKLMLPVLEAGWETGGQELAKSVAEAFPTLPPVILGRLAR